MKKCGFRAFSTLVIIVILAFSSVVSVSSKEKTADSEFIEIQNPTNESVWYKGDQIPVITIVADIYEDYSTLPVIGIYRGQGTGLYDMFQGTDTVDKNSRGDGYGFYLDTTPYKNGTYRMVCYGVAVEDPDDCDGALDNSTPRSQVTITVKTLAAPKSIAARKKGERVRLTFKKTNGAMKYEVYRADSRGGKYKKIGTTKTNTFTDKKAGAKKHYYKVKAVRTKYGTVKSTFSKVAKK